MTIAALIVAAGRGRRASPGTGAPSETEAAAGEVPKQYRDVDGRSLLAYSIAAFVDHPRVDQVLVVIHEQDAAHYERIVGEFGSGLLPPVEGGATRQDSVRAGLEALSASNPDKVLIHDAARPFVDAALIQRVIDSLDAHTGALPCLAVTDTLKRGKNGIVTETVDRAGLWRAQTPQGFHFKSIFEAHRAAVSLGGDFTDDASIAEWYGLDVAQVEGAEANRKFTTAEDFIMAEAMLSGGGTVSGLRVGSGYDVHRTEPGDRVILGGVAIPSDKQLVGHSDADVVLHAITDALLGAIADGDIGLHFPPSDARWRGADSVAFLEDALARVKAKNGEILNVDVTVLCERPKISPHRDAMRGRIAEVLGLPLDRIAVKATTHEKLGPIGREEGIAAMATVMLNLV
ncbi:bifunctional 2-C-methyl-D-erythritol 4-phosphate cytidylyltransferase/2-C-methyl-D-erythritol 2,4-cyclodiphosphate synthase [Methyloligella sp. 2.7D]|uniref:bifunctional 2-C-methyl-D-erythritol 4-phosphate cytidylyltransferase/2-C-methyl-D-erythritol 2,4-cyclodiphosphate synthase n=1 Tax=unclassified Methyloligella TaxID=2625955 RepID=UPI00157DBB1E|nr:bifunctional 2-C-methyl-D-erythritol 4-phosphate cytidylyltransferase/2-C-methyl-D-erythritol 2,4-cyclodiphosphate synthase [Methyloligella sp. GL2]QKP77485.1 bifunctional 2-C-methyl-D-erythritol 4-phosphate cytidylyltransferase/2-C-methyl-D-erythritol 2,4-cyclodiphosphate synthase [Methyloligella sp. GL2]